MPETTPEFIARVQGYCDARDVIRARTYFAANPGNGMDDCMRWGEGLCHHCAEMVTSPCLGTDLDVFCEHALADLPRALKALGQYGSVVTRFLELYEEGGDVKHLVFALVGIEDAVARILNGEEVDDAGSD